MDRLLDCFFLHNARFAAVFHVYLNSRHIKINDFTLRNALFFRAHPLKRSSPYDIPHWPPGIAVAHGDAPVGGNAVNAAGYNIGEEIHV